MILERIAWPLRVIYPYGLLIFVALASAALYYRAKGSHSDIRLSDYAFSASLIFLFVSFLTYAVFQTWRGFDSYLQNILSMFIFCVPVTIVTVIGVGSSRDNWDRALSSLFFLIMAPLAAATVLKALELLLRLFRRLLDN